MCAGRRRNVNCLKNVVIWYEDHKHRCPYEPHLVELDPTFGLYTTAVWQCEAGHRYFQDLHSPLKPLSDSDPDSDKGGSEGQGYTVTSNVWGSTLLKGRVALASPPSWVLSVSGYHHKPHSTRQHWSWLQGWSTDSSGWLQSSSLYRAQ